ncbi:flagellar hook-length control protein FliK [Pseudophaeobacter arcticus]|uniref:flagellar hook-length control protein FliK n=1 Tax=Pseudophaeobacter arcticus TaxID=385492 RepID=UPI00040AC21F|nr:flagellar hook-length control protein FliK [Pseudophaeobacter arcticus]
MLTNVLFGQVRSGAADPVGVKATEGPSRQHPNRSFSDHVDDRARREEARSASERERSIRADKADEQQDAKARSKAADQNQSDTGKPNAAKVTAEGADVPASKEGAKTAAAVADPDATEATISQQTEETPEGVDAAEVAETDVLDSDTASDTDVNGETEIAAQGTEVPPLGLHQETDIKPTAASATADSGTSGQASKSPMTGSTEAAVAAGESTEVAAQVTLAEAAPDSMDDGITGDAETAFGKSAQSAAGAATAAAGAPQTAVQAAAQADAQQKAAAATAVNPDQNVTADPEQSDRAQVVASAATGAAASQNGALRPGDSRSATAKSVIASQAAGANDAAQAKVAQAKVMQADDPAAEVTADTAEPEVAGKSASSGEVLAAVAGQTRTATATEPGRRAEGRARESREAQAVVTGNAAATPATKPTAATAQISAVQQAFAAQVLAGDATAAGGQGADTQVLSLDLTSNLPGLSQLLTEAVAQPGTVHRPETPRMVAVQLAQAIVAKGDRNVDVALNPEELGRVKMRVSTSETGITVVIQTERAETGDLMRRHINELADEFRKMGFQNVSFEFSGGGASGGETRSEGGSPSGLGRSGTEELDDLTATELAEKQVQHLRLGNAGVDMRV